MSAIQKREGTIKESFNINQVFLLNRSDRYTALEGLRGIAVLMIYFVHFFAYYNKQSFLSEEYSVLSALIRFLSSGQIGVDLFFVLSGFFISISLAKRSSSFWSFMKKRFIRLLPAHAFILTILVLFHKSFDPTMIITNIFFINIFFENIKIINIVTWSLGYEVVFYTIYGLWKIKLKNIKALHSTFAFFIVFIGLWTAQWWGQPLVSWISTNTLKIPDMSRFIGFVFGVGIAKLYLSDKLRRKYTKFINMMLVPAIGGLVLLQWYWELGRLHKPVYFLMVDFAFCILIAGVLIKNKYISFLLERRFLRLSGGISYSFYLSHPIILSLTYGLTKDMDKYLGFAIHFILSLSLTYFVSALMFILFEKPYFTKGSAAKGRL